MRNILANLFRRSEPSRQPRSCRIVRGRFDAAQTTPENRRHWAAADGHSADAEASPEVRKALRERARYEVANNSYAKGIVVTLANDTIGTGPRLQMLTGSDELNNELEHAFAGWARAVRLPEKLRTMRMSRCQDGEAFAMLAENPAIDHDIQIDVALIEADRVTSDLSALGRSDEVDGIRLDAYGNPTSYRVLKHHPGDTQFDIGQKALDVPAQAMIHIFRANRPELHRGIPEITPALPLFAQLRRYTLAVLSAAEAAADFAGILYTDAPASGEADAVEPMDLVQLERNMLLTMPGGWKMSQLDPKQPATTYGEFKREILNEIARCLNLPYNIAAGNSSGYNYASGRLDHQTYYKAIRVDQAFIAARVLDRILAVWLREYALSHDVAAPFEHQWFWDGQEHVDPYKEANAQRLRLQNNTTTLSHEYARHGLDWESELHQRAREKSLMRELGLIDSDITPVNPGEPRP